MTKKLFIFFLLPFLYLTLKAQTSSIIESNLCGYYSQIFGFEVKSIKNLKLYETIEDWMGTKYKYAGETKEGIDCSRFVATLFDKAFNITMPSNSKDIYSFSEPIRTSELREGDLVFFNTLGHGISHLGVYLGENRFAHTSFLIGVTVSDLSNPYFRKTYMAAGRYMGFNSANSESIIR